jgi:HPt (histidine-containing phosphotransfer) domain-containing protein
MTIQNIVLAHERDAAWIIALWKAIHGGDPAPEIVAAQAIASLAQYLHGAANSLSFSQLEKGRPRQYCFKFQGKTICTELPQVKHTQAAA